MNELSFFEKIVDEKILNIHTAYLGKVVSISGKKALIQPLTIRKAAGGKAAKQNVVSAVIPSNIKYKHTDITYLVSETRSKTSTVLTPDELCIGDIVYVGVCERDISYAANGVISEASNRHHNINDGVILRVL